MANTRGHNPQQHFASLGHGSVYFHDFQHGAASGNGGAAIIDRLQQSKNKTQSVNQRQVINNPGKSKTLLLCRDNQP